MPKIAESLMKTGAVAVVALLVSWQATAQTQFPSDAKQSCTVSSDDFEKWITLNSIRGVDTVGPAYDTDSGMVYVFPPDGPDFSSMATDCDFYKWAARMFLWTTSTVSDVFTKPANPTAPTSETNYVFTSEFFYDLETDANGNLVLGAQGPETGQSNPMPLRVRSLKPMTGGGLRPVDDEGNAQAGGGGVLISQAANSVSSQSSLVYYSVLTNRVYGYFLNLAGTETTFPFPDNGLAVCLNILHGLLGGYAEFSDTSFLLFLNYCAPFQSLPEVASGLEKLNSKARDQGIEAGLPTSSGGVTIPSLETAIDYLSMVVELKASWVPSSTLQHPERYVRQMANIYDYDMSSDTLWKRTGVASDPVEMAMVGMHVVATVDGHPEMVWATIEHVDNAPNGDYPYLDTNDNVKQTSETSASPNGNWLFSDGTATTSVTENSTVLSEDQKNGDGKKGDIAANSGETIGPVNVNRLVPWGNPSSENTGSDPTLRADRNAQIISMNSSVLQNVSAQLSGDPRANYFVSGATWTQGGRIPVTGDETFITGSTMLANTTMETFHQDLNCFSCHARFTDSSGQPNPPVSISHLFQDLQTTLPKAE